MLLALSPSTVRAAVVGGPISPLTACDGTSDRTLAIQAAIATAVATGSGAVYLPGGSGACIMSTTVTLPSNVTVKGDG
ncbi:MAG TPA: glycosyl hydrolase family 28-related protein, partial [Burkholderiales bacterium]|nr:glycosyl hydrolase family 28-related protein [Burkholderiales bacterium]